MQTRKCILLIVLILIVQLMVLVPDVGADDELEWEEKITVSGSCQDSNIRRHFTVNRTVVQIDVELFWTTDAGSADLDIWIEDTVGYVVDATATLEMPEIMRIRDFPNRGRWTVVVAPAACGTYGPANYTLNLTMHHIVLPEMSISSLEIEPKDRVNLTLTSQYQNISSYYFDFGDETNSDWILDSSISKTYNRSGKYTPMAKVRYNDGSESDWVEVGSIKVQKEEKVNIFLWVIIWLVILEGIIFLVMHLHFRRSTD